MEESKEDFSKIVANLKELAARTRNSSVRLIGDINLDDLEQVLIEASEAIENLVDLSINLVDKDGNIIFQIPDEYVRMWMFDAVDAFIKDSTAPSLIIPKHTMGDIVSNTGWGNIG